jgi:hypothetical protein
LHRRHHFSAISRVDLNEKIQAHGPDQRRKSAVLITDIGGVMSIALLPICQMSARQCPMPPTVKPRKSICSHSTQVPRLRA